MNHKNKNVLFTTNLKIKLPKIKEIVTHGKHDTLIFKGSYESVKAIVKKVRRTDDLKQKLRSTCYHDNEFAFLGWETDGEFDYYAFEECGVTLTEYVKNRMYMEMGETSLKIMCGLVDGVKHLHTKGLVYMNHNPQNVLVNDDDTVKNCGMGNGKFLHEET
ncbi:serine/threonine-protein kinase/endoribonuclease IRE1 [Artemisia annua]|uniref:Serine/threonine-protein kinase/endoribonuclease IRE1 n=1 Tax=Artemisia annua TaxID=35608 RepID=A0A2U1KDB6_ARTAN|nr:serine/threonine-protein kinase/endoribonuclease IRE1 [Artemisia annua]